MTTVTRNTSFDPGRFIGLVAGALALACLVFIAYMLYSNQSRTRAVTHQETMECLDAAQRGYGLASVCLDRAKAAR